MKIGSIRVSTQEQNTLRQETMMGHFARTIRDLLELIEQLSAKGEQEKLPLQKL